MQKKIALTGDRPTGPLHLGHLVGSLSSRIRLQDETEQFIMIADMQALTDHADDPVLVRNNVLEVALDNLAAGVDPAKSIIFIQSLVPEISELAMYFMNLVTLARLERNPTVKEEMRQKGYGPNVPVGFMVYPISQAADILAFKASIVPVGGDQMPMIELTNEIARKFNATYGDTFREVEGLVSETPRLKGIDGHAKMSKTLKNAIYLSDDRDTLERKVMQMYTDPTHIHIDEPGKIEGNTVFSYLSVFDSDKDEFEELKKEYEKGGIGDVTIKKRLLDVLNHLLEPIREKREYLSRAPNRVMDILKEGSRTAEKAARSTLDEVKSKMKINYF